MPITATFTVLTSDGTALNTVTFTDDMDLSGEEVRILDYWLRWAGDARARDILQRHYEAIDEPQVIAASVPGAYLSYPLDSCVVIIRDGHTLMLDEEDWDETTVQDGDQLIFDTHVRPT